MDSFPKKIWVVSREYAGIAEAGGVKNVACSLCECLAKNNIDVTLLIPRYGCTDFSKVKHYKPNIIPPQLIYVEGKNYTVFFDKAQINDVNIVFIVHQIFSDKRGVYTYTATDEALNKDNPRGIGFHDSLTMDVLFQKAVVCYGEIIGSGPDIVHCQDAATALIPAMATCYSKADSVFNATNFVVTIHNAGPGYHHEFNSVWQAESYTNLPRSVLEQCQNGNAVEPFLIASNYATMNTVSPWYAKELTNSFFTEETGGLANLFSDKGVTISGITNGIDCYRYSPIDTKKSLLPYPFDPLKSDFDGKYQNRFYFLKKYAAENSPKKNYSSFNRFGFLEEDRKDFLFFCYHGRIVRQKGIDVLISTAQRILSQKDSPLCFVIVGQGESELENELSKLASLYKGRCVYFQGYERAISRLAVAISDFILLPSKFEPCCLEDFIAQMYGTIPVAHGTGGLKKILDGKTGFLYSPNTPEELLQTIESLEKKWCTDKTWLKQMAKFSAEYVKNNYSWDSVISNCYMPFYRSLKKQY
ncbi:MAG: glycogen/starch synthase [Spirochaetaceae bacterium]|nr:glycogen/starch synthase [Spirochaetaceae bacterium]